MNNLRLGLGLLSIGRQWGVCDVLPPSDVVARELILTARTKNIRFFDTAPAYGDSERILGDVISSNNELFLDSVIATKVGEHWMPDSQKTFVDHSYDAMCYSIDRSLEHLCRIDLLQIHKATEKVLINLDIERVIEYARQCGIASFGASISSHKDAIAAAQTGLFDWLQFPLNSNHNDLSKAIGIVKQCGVKAIINRPFAMGLLAQSGRQKRIEAYKFILKAGLPEGSIILSGTSSKTHLLENILNFESANE